MGSGDLYRNIVAPLDVGLRRFSDSGLHLVSLSEYALIQMDDPSSLYGAISGTWVREGAVGLGSDEFCLVRENPFLCDPGVVSGVLCGSDEFVVSGELLTGILDDSVSVGRGFIPVSSFGSNPQTVFMFGGVEAASRYGSFLQGYDIEGLEVLLGRDPDEKVGSVRPLRFCVASHGGSAYLFGDSGISNGQKYPMVGVPDNKGQSAA